MRVKDGLSKTLLASEVRTLDRDWDSRGVWSVPLPGASIIGVNFHDVDEQHRTPYYRPNPNGAGNVRLPNIQERMADQIASCMQPLYALQQKMPCRQTESIYAAVRSNHPGGVSAITLDCSVGFLTDDIDPFVYAYLVSINDGNAINVSDAIR